MKTHGRTFLVVLASLTIATLGGCNNKEIAPADETEAGVTFKATHGLQISTATAQFIGLKVADVEERKANAVLQFSAQVYRSANEAQFVSTQPGTAPPNASANGSANTAAAAQLREGQTITVIADGGVSLPGRIMALDRTLEKANGQVEVLLSIPDGGRQLSNNAIVSVIVSVGAEKTVTTVPRSAFLRTTEGDFVYTVNGDYFVRAPIRIGNSTREFVEVTDGLYAGDRIVVKPVMTLWMAELQFLRGGKPCADGQ
jgi:hypothetical protein